MQNGTALQKFKEMIIFQGVDPKVADNLCKDEPSMWTILPKSKYNTELQVSKCGIIQSIDALVIGTVCVDLG